MNALPILRGYEFSVYNRIARVALHEKGVAYQSEEVNPFEADVPQDYLERHPFGRVPVLSHGDFDVYETVAICRYVDAAFDGPPLLPVRAEALARVAQVMSIIDSYGYWSMVRKVFAQRVFRPAVGQQPDESVIRRGMEDAQTVLSALNLIADEGLCLDGKTVTLADCHLAPMLAYFVQADEGAKALAAHSALADWWAQIAGRDSILHTDPSLPTHWEFSDG